MQKLLLPSILFSLEHPDVLLQPLVALASPQKLTVGGAGDFKDSLFTAALGTNRTVESGAGTLTLPLATFDALHGESV